MLSLVAFVLLTPSCAARGVIDGKKAAQLVNSVFSQENQTRLSELEKPRLNSTDEALFLKQYQHSDTEESSAAGVTAEGYSEVSFEAIIELSKVHEEPKMNEQPKKVQKAKDVTKHKHHHLRHDESPKPSVHPADGASAVQPPKTFIDLGSGLGRSVLFACALGSFESCEGVELSQSRHQMALDALAKFKHLAPGASKHVTFHQGNLLDNDSYFKKDVMLLDNRFLSDGVEESIVRKFRQFSQPGSIMLVTKKLNQLSPRAATYERMTVAGKNNKETLFKYTRT